VTSVAPKQPRPERGCEGRDRQAQQGGEENPRAHQFHVVANGHGVSFALQSGDVRHGTEGQPHVGARCNEIGGAAEVVNLPHSTGFEQQSGDFVAHHRHERIESLHPAEEAGVFQDAPDGGLVAVVGFHAGKAKRLR